MKLLAGRHNRVDPCFRRRSCNIILDTRKRLSSNRAEYIELTLQIRHNLQDCLYLAAARKLGAELITADSKFRDRVHPFDSRITLLRGCEPN